MAHVETARKLIGSGFRPLLAYGTLVLTMYELRHLNLLPRFNDLFLFLMVAYSVQMTVEIIFGVLTTWGRGEPPETSTSEGLSEDYFTELKQILEKQLQERIELEQRLKDTLAALTDKYTALSTDVKALSEDVKTLSKDIGALDTDTKELSETRKMQSADTKTLNETLNKIFKIR